MEYQEGCLRQSCPTCKTSFKCKTKLHYYVEREQDLIILKENIKNLNAGSTQPMNNKEAMIEAIERVDYIMNYGV